MPDRGKAIRILEGHYKNCVLRHDGELITINELVMLLKERAKQYENGWNDAMDYAFMHGNGYKPYTYQNDNKEE